jgi:hypothetical protein
MACNEEVERSRGKLSITHSILCPYGPVKVEDDDLVQGHSQSRNISVADGWPRYQMPLFDHCLRFTKFVLQEIKLASIHLPRERWHKRSQPCMYQNFLPVRRSLGGGSERPEPGLWKVSELLRFSNSHLGGI